MNILFLENEGFWRGQCLLNLNSGNEHNIDVLTDIQLSVPLEELARNFAEEFPFVDLLFINVNLLVGGNSRSECTGISLFKYIRLYHFDKHCILYSFFSREQLMQLSPDNLIIFSEGVTFVQLPYDFSKFDFENLAKHKAPADLSRYLKAESRLPDDRHFFANWWGVLQLWEIHKRLYSIDEPTSQIIHHQLFNATKEIGTFQGLLARYLFRREFKQLSPEYIESKRDHHKYSKQLNLSPNDYKERIQELSATIEFAPMEINRLNNISLAIMVPGKLQQLFLNWSGIKRNILDTINDYEIRLNEAKDEKQKIILVQELEKFIEEEKNKVIEEQDRLIAYKATIEKEKQNAELNLDIRLSYAQILREKAPKILYIDDQVDEGWGSIFQLMVYGIERPEKFKIIKPEKQSDISDVIFNCFGSVEDFDPDLIILDLRLFGETGTIANPNDLSGMKVLKALKSGFKYNSYTKFNSVHCPVMIVTASNKAFTYQSINAARADAFWIKEGLDNKFSLDESIHNYWDFIRKVYILCCIEEFHFLEKIKKGLTRLKTSNSEFWWESDKRFSSLVALDATLNKTSKAIVFSILNECIVLSENFLQGLILKNHSFTFENSLPSLIAIRLFQIVEIIHDENVNEYAEITLSKRIVEHHKNERYGKLTKLLKLRNNAVHDNSTTMEDLECLFTYLIEYLEFNPKSITLKPFADYPTSDQDSSQNIDQTKKRYSSTIIKKKYDCIIISKNGEELQNDFSMSRNLQCFDRKIMKDSRCKEGASVEFEVKLLTEDKYMALNLIFL